MSFWHFMSLHSRVAERRNLRRIRLISPNSTRRTPRYLESALTARLPMALSPKNSAYCSRCSAISNAPHQRITVYLTKTAAMLLAQHSLSIRKASFATWSRATAQSISRALRRPAACSRRSKRHFWVSQEAVEQTGQTVL